MIYLNLAPFKYKTILNDSKSPIEKIDIAQLVDEKGFRYFEAYGWLKESLKFTDIEQSAFYGSCEATGTDRYFQLAYWKCVSELIERWAVNHLLINRISNFGMGIDSTSTGFAALPCWPTYAVRKIAYGEAIERWAISNWWRGYLTSFIEVKPRAEGDIGVVRINIKASVGNVVIVFKRKIFSENSFYCYGFAFGKNLKEAVKKATIELIRNENVLAKKNSVVASSISDIRLKYFSTDEGFLDFFSKIKSSENNFKNIPDLIVDCEVPGEWSRFAIVWRCLLPETVYNWHDHRHFMF